MGFIKGVFKFILVVIVLVVFGYGGYTYGQMSLQENLFEVEVPINESFSFMINQNVSFPVDTVLEVPINESFLVSENVPVNVMVPIDSVVKVPMNISGQIVLVDVPIKSQIPINTSFKINKTIFINKIVNFRIQKNVDILINKEIIVPVDGTFTTEIPVPEWMNKND